jgi:biotin-(acetyl-CoA carboxylase) ligase
MTDKPVFPPPYSPIAVTDGLDPFERALTIAREGAEAGAILWSVRADRAECAVVLAPENPLEQSLPVLQVALLALGDALGALLPPLVAVTFDWPDRLLVNGGLVGGVRLAVAPIQPDNAVPDWLVIGIGIALTEPVATAGPAGSAPTTLAAEGCGGVAATELLAAFSRHFLGWINRWQEEGVTTVHQAWLARVPSLGRDVRIGVEGEIRQGRFSGLTERGDLRLGEGERAALVPLQAATRQPSWLG